jgi:hypothetical protein
MPSFRRSHLGDWVTEKPNENTSFKRRLRVLFSIVSSSFGGRMLRTVAGISALLFLLFSVGSLRSQGQQGGQPPMPFTDEGACPFEGCQYANWIARASTVARKEASISSPVVFAIKSGEKVTALKGEVITRQFGIVKVLEHHVFEGGFEAPAGAVLYVLHGVGEGGFLFWYGGTSHIDNLYAETVHKGDTNFPWDVISLPKTEWWANVGNSDGKTGWVLNPNFQCTDALGGEQC